MGRIGTREYLTKCIRTKFSHINQHQFPINKLKQFWWTSKQIIRGENYPWRQIYLVKFSHINLIKFPIKKLKQFWWTIKKIILEDKSTHRLPSRSMPILLIGTALWIKLLRNEVQVYRSNSGKTTKGGWGLIVSQMNDLTMKHQQGRIINWNKCY